MTVFLETHHCEMTSKEILSTHWSCSQKCVMDPPLLGRPLWRMKFYSGFHIFHRGDGATRNAFREVIRKKTLKLYHMVGNDQSKIPFVSHSPCPSSHTLLLLIHSMSLGLATAVCSLVSLTEFWCPLCLLQTSDTTYPPTLLTSTPLPHSSQDELFCL
jgi:hypothetical protein